MKDLFVRKFEGVSLLYVGILMASNHFVTYKPLYWYTGLFLTICATILKFRSYYDQKKIINKLLKEDKGFSRFQFFSYIFANFSFIFFIIVTIIKNT